MENMDRFKRRKEGSIRSLPEIRRAVRLKQSITPGEERVLREALASADNETTRDVSTLDNPTDIKQGQEVDAEQVSAENAQHKAETETGPPELHGAAAKAAADPEAAALELAPPGPDHEAFGAHDAAVATTQKAIVDMERAFGPADKRDAVKGLFDAALEHQGVSRQFEALAQHLSDHDYVGAPKARALATAHHNTARAITKAATTGKTVHYQQAHASAQATEAKAKELSGTLQEQARKRHDKAKADAKKLAGQPVSGPPEVADAAARLDRRLAKRP